MRRKALAGAGLLLACIIPDSDIDVRPPRTNPGAVRIVQAVSLTEEAVAACAEEPILGEEDSQRQTCPLPPITQPPGLIQIPGQSFCFCPEGSVDANALLAFDIFVEDPDVDPMTGQPADDLFGVFLLDVGPGDDDLTDNIAYTNYLNPFEPAELVLLGPGSYAEPIEREKTFVKSWLIGVDQRVDLCNDNEGGPLPDERLHALRLVVTDRPWYVPVERKEDGSPVVEDGELVRPEVDALVGVPDLPAGATYAVANYVFECLTEDAQAETSVCRCESTEEAQ